MLRGCVLSPSGHSSCVQSGLPPPCWLPPRLCPRPALTEHVGWLWGQPGDMLSSTASRAPEEKPALCFLPVYDRETEAFRTLAGCRDAAPALGGPKSLPLETPEPGSVGGREGCPRVSKNSLPGQKCVCMGPRLSRRRDSILVTWGSTVSRWPQAGRAATALGQGRSLHVSYCLCENPRGPRVRNPPPPQDAGLTQRVVILARRCPLHQPQRRQRSPSSSQWRPDAANSPPCPGQPPQQAELNLNSSSSEVRKP